MGIPFRGHGDGRESCVDEQRGKEPRSNQRQRSRGGRNQSEGTLSMDEIRIPRYLREGVEAYQRSLEEGEGYTVTLEVDRSLRGIGNGSFGRSSRENSGSDRNRLLDTIIQVHRSRMDGLGMQGTGGELDEEVDDEIIRGACHRVAHQIHTYLRNVGQRVRLLPRRRQTDEFAWAFHAVQVMVGHRSRFEGRAGGVPGEYSPMISYSVESMADRLVVIWREEANTSSEQIVERFHRAVEDGNLTSVFQMAALMRSALGVVGPTGDTALHLACLHGHFEIAQFLLEMGHAPDGVDEDGSTPLHDAAAGGFVPIVRLMIEKAPICVDMLDNDGDSPLHNAARGDHCECVEILLEAGADPGCTNSMSLRPIDLTAPGYGTYTRLLQVSRDVPHSGYATVMYPDPQ